MRNSAQRHRHGRGTRALALLGAILLATALAACSGGDGDGQAAQMNQAAQTNQAGVVATPAGAANQLIPDLVQRVDPSVVAIQHPKGEGSGIVWSADGVIVTNNHVIADQKVVDVVFADGKRVKGDVLATDPADDLAVVRAARKGLPPATFAERQVRVGELAVAIGNPLGFENSVTAGIVSGLNRAIPGSVLAGETSLVDLLQTDAPISPGNSGGALIGADGQVIGVNVAYIPPSAGSVSIGFAIPSQRARYVVEQLLDDGTVELAYLGVRFQVLTPEIAQRFGIDAKAGVIVESVEPGGPADKAGIEPGDVIVAVEGREMEQPEDLFSALRARKPGDTMRVTVLRGGQRTDITVTLGEQPVAGGR